MSFGVRGESLFHILFGSRSRSPLPCPVNLMNIPGSIPDTRTHTLRARNVNGDDAIPNKTNRNAWNCAIDGRACTHCSCDIRSENNMSARRAYCCIASIRNNRNELPKYSQTLNIDLGEHKSAGSATWQGDGHKAHTQQQHVTEWLKAIDRTDIRQPMSAMNKCCLLWVVSARPHGPPLNAMLIDWLRNWLCSTQFRMQTEAQSPQFHFGPHRTQEPTTDKHNMGIWHTTVSSRINNTRWRPDYVDIFVYLLPCHRHRAMTTFFFFAFYAVRRSPAPL